MVLGVVRQHERIRSRTGEVIDISPYGALEGIRRWVAGESREHNLNAVQSVLDSAFNYVVMLVDRVENTGHMPSGDKTFMRRLNRAILVAKKGCVALQTTYAADPVATARLQCMVESIDQHVAALAPWLAE